MDPTKPLPTHVRDVTVAIDDHGPLQALVPEEDDKLSVNNIDVANKGLVTIGFGSNGKEELFLWDTGAQKSCIKKETYDRIPPQHKTAIRPFHGSLVATNDTPLGMHGEATIRFTLGPLTITANVVITNGIRNRGILGLELMRIYRLEFRLTDRLYWYVHRKGYGPVVILRRLNTPLAHVRAICHLEVPGNSNAAIPAYLTTQVQLSEGNFVAQSNLPIWDGPIDLDRKEQPFLLQNKKDTPIHIRKGDILGAVYAPLEVAEITYTRRTDPHLDRLVIEDVSHVIMAPETEENTIEATPTLSKALPLPGDIQRQLDHMLEKEYKGSFAADEKDLGTTDLVKMRIETGDTPPISQKYYPVADKHREWVNEEVKKLLESGIIRDSYSSWNAPIVIVGKKDGNQRMCIDYRKLNLHTRKFVWPMPRIEDIFRKLHGAKVFTSLDLKSGYHHMVLDKESIPKTAFTSELGRYEYTRVPFGLAQAPAYFQHLMFKVLEGLDFATAYLDDIIIFSETLEEHLQHLKAVLRRLKAANLKMKMSKCKFFQGQADYLGHIVSAEGVRTNPEKVEAIIAMKAPTDVKRVRGFLGMIGYYRRFIKNFSDIATPLTALTKKGAPFKWTPECQAAFERLKQDMVSAPILRYPNPNLPYLVYTDASDNACGAMLAQRRLTDSQPHPIAYLSHSFTPCQKKWATNEQECFGIYFALRKWHNIVFGRDVIVYNDHKPLEHMMTAQSANSKINRWATEIMDYSPTFKWIPGSQNLAADFLSRMNHHQKAGIQEIAVETLIDFTDPGMMACPPSNLEPIEEEPDLIRWDEEDGVAPLRTHAEETLADTQGTCTVSAIHGGMLETTQAEKPPPTPLEEEGVAPLRTHTEEALADTQGECTASTIHGGMPGALEPAEMQNEGSPDPTFQGPSPLSSGIKWTDIPILEEEEWEFRGMDNDHGPPQDMNQICEILTQERDSMGVPLKELQGGDPYCRRMLERADLPTSFSVREGILYRTVEDKGKLFQAAVVPRQARHTILAQTHDCLGHQGRERTYNLTRRLYYWKNMGKDIGRYVEDCWSCSLNRVRHDMYPPVTTEVPRRPFEEVAMDLVVDIGMTERGNQHMLTMIDLLTGWPFAFPIPDKTADTVVNTLLERYIPEKWCPRSLLSDNGTEFKNSVMDYVCQELNIERRYSSPHHPESNGKLERFHSFLKGNLTKMCIRDKVNWDRCVPAVLAAYRVAPHTSTGDTPFFLVHGYDPPIPITKLLQPRLRYIGDDQGRLQLDRLHQAVASARYNLVEARSRQGYYKAKKTNRGDPDYHIGQRVMLRNHGKSALDTRWLPGYRIIEISRNGRGFTLQEHSQTSSRIRRANITDIAPDPYVNSWLRTQTEFGRPAKYINHPDIVGDPEIDAGTANCPSEQWSDKGGPTEHPPVTDKDAMSHGGSPETPPSTTITDTDVDNEGSPGTPRPHHQTDTQRLNEGSPHRAESPAGDSTPAPRKGARQPDTPFSMTLRPRNKGEQGPHK